MTNSSSAIDREIAHFMVDQKLTQAKMAGLLGITEQTLIHKRRGVRDWKWGEVLHLSDILGKSLDELAGLK